MGQSLLYDYQYDIAAIIATLVLLIFFAIRRKMNTLSNKVFVAVMTCDLVAAVFDCISCFSISYPQDYPLWVNYLTSLGYLLFYNMMSVLYFMYITIKADVKNVMTRAYMIACTVFYVVTIVSSPWTHFIAYFDDGLKYCHGPLMSVLFVIPFFTFFMEIGILVKARKRFNLYQIEAVIGLIVAMAVGTIIQLIWSRLLVGTMLCALILFFVYMCFENPAVFTYKDTQCSNRSAFLQKHQDILNKKDIYDLITIGICDYNILLHSHGQLFMEQLNSKIADVLYNTFKQYVFYLNTDKYVIMIPVRKKLTEKFVNKLANLFEEPIVIGEDEITISLTTSILSNIDEKYSTDDIENIIYQKITNPSAGDTASEIYDKMVIKRLRREKLIQIIRRAIAKDEFQVYYQPIREVSTGKYVSAEALLRLNDPELGFINPEEIVTLAEEYGYINIIGEMIFTKVCKFIKENGLMSLNVHYIEINLSSVQCEQEDLSEIFHNIMKSYEIKPEWINLEFTETAKMNDISKTKENIELLSSRGITFSIDDYGSGFASADYLIKLPVDIVKIDKLILWEAMKDKKAMFVLINTMRMIHDLGKKIVVEGVEDEDMVMVLAANNCDYMQGYYYSKPLQGDKYIEFIKEKNMEG